MKTDLPVTARTGRDYRFLAMDQVNDEFKPNDFSGCIDATLYLPSGSVANAYYRMSDGRVFANSHTLVIRPRTFS